ncbi:MAG: LysR family transcriptional regulator [Lachnospiraceae bacterium]|nr:LysR family transcriptional regulator [Lachnospiraceae bacterium]
MEQHLSQYRIFYEVARWGNISRAAKELYISQPAISKAISRLEDNLNTRLFTRSSRGVLLTREGTILFEHVRTAFDSIGRGERELKRIHDFHIGQLKIGVSNTLCKYVLLPYLKGFVERFPHVSISIASQSTARTVSMLEDKKLDIGLVAEPRARRGLAFLPVMSINDGFVCTPAYRDNLLLREGGEANVFQAGNLILLDRSNMSRKHIDAYLAEHQLVLSQPLEVTDMTLLIEFARIGLGICCVVKDFISEDLKNGTLIEIPLDAPIPGRVIGFSYSPHDMSDTLSDFLEFCRHFRHA